MSSRPGPEVLAAFGLGHAVVPRPLAGGQGTAWAAGDLLLKPVSNVTEAEWVGSILCDVPERGVRVSRPGEFVGWDLDGSGMVSVAQIGRNARLLGPMA